MADYIFAGPPHSTAYDSQVEQTVVAPDGNRPPRKNDLGTPVLRGARTAAESNVAGIYLHGESAVRIKVIARDGNVQVNVPVPLLAYDVVPGNADWVRNQSEDSVIELAEIDGVFSGATTVEITDPWEGISRAWVPDVSLLTTAEEFFDISYLVYCKS